MNLLEMGESSLNIVLVVQAEAPEGSKIVRSESTYYHISIPEEECANMSLILLQN